jgi:hypothetical protein
MRLQSIGVEVEKRQKSGIQRKPVAAFLSLPPGPLPAKPRFMGFSELA